MSDANRAASACVELFAAGLSRTSRAGRRQAWQGDPPTSCVPPKVRLVKGSQGEGRERRGVCVVRRACILDVGDTEIPTPPSNLTLSNFRRPLICVVSCADGGTHASQPPWRGVSGHFQPSVSVHAAALQTLMRHVPLLRLRQVVQRLAVQQQHALVRFLNELGGTRGTSQPSSQRPRQCRCARHSNVVTLHATCFQYHCRA